MPRSRGSRSRRSHTKSRTGCSTCCNCSRYGARCTYNAPVTPAQTVWAVLSTNPISTPRLEAAVRDWRCSGRFPFPSLSDYALSMPEQYPEQDLRLIYHISNIYHQLASVEANDLTLWTRYIPILLSIGTTIPYVMDAVLALAASHIAASTNCLSTFKLALEHRNAALQGLQSALDNFRQETSDAVLAASLVPLLAGH
ncbi:hypothetical protein ACCO45_009883 [Purpureocillium lilacinum]|uniref:Uncharacterized protein n=1 Tax=Purpureocillium lilacinum TaxID=33203 RepID=A0ACC4DHS9_PURLI